jgi:hypothetical protein
VQVADSLQRSQEDTLPKIPAKVAATPAESLTAAVGVLVAGYLGISNSDATALVVLVLSLLPHVVTAVVNKYGKPAAALIPPTVPPTTPPTP